MTVPRKKLIEIALPLDAINAASQREKSIRHGHPSTLHLWWARRPLAAARAVIFAQMVDDPSASSTSFLSGGEFVNSHFVCLQHLYIYTCLAILPRSIAIYDKTET